MAVPFGLLKKISAVVSGVNSGNKNVEVNTAKSRCAQKSLSFPFKVATSALQENFFLCAIYEVSFLQVAGNDRTIIQRPFLISPPPLELSAHPFLALFPSLFPLSLFHKFH